MHQNHKTMTPITFRRVQPSSYDALDLSDNGDSKTCREGWEGIDQPAGMDIVLLNFGTKAEEVGGEPLWSGWRASPWERHFHLLHARPAQSSAEQPTFLSRSWSWFLPLALLLSLASSLLHPRLRPNVKPPPPQPQQRRPSLRRWTPSRPPSRAAAAKP